MPTLVVDGRPITEAAAIALQLADAHPAGKLAPPLGQRGAYYQWMMFCANTLQPAYRAWFYPDEPAGAASSAASKDHARARIESAWDRVDAHLATHAPYMLGAQLTAVDFMITMLMRWSRNMPSPADTRPNVKRLATAMKQRPSFVELYRREQLTDWA